MLDVELGGPLSTIHLYLRDEAGPTPLAETVGFHDPLLEQLVLALDRVVQAGQPASRTYADQLAATVGAHG